MQVPPLGPWDTLFLCLRPVYQVLSQGVRKHVHTHMQSSQPVPECLRELGTGQCTVAASWESLL